VADVNILMGVARQTQWRIRHPLPADESGTAKGKASA
jgi:hypothetical protein